METGRVFTEENGEMLHPANVTRRFTELYEEIGLPPIRLHDLRHGAATLAHAAGADLKDFQEMLGHSSIAITADTYTSLPPEADRAIAEAAARLVPRARRPGDAETAETEPEAAHSVESGAEDMPNDAGESAAQPGHGDASTHAPLTQTAPDRRSPRPNRTSRLGESPVRAGFPEPPVGFEPTTFALQERCSDQLS